MSFNKIFIYSFASLVLLFLIAPTFIVIPLSFSSSRYMEFPPPGFSLQWYDSFFSDPEWMGSLFLSLKVGIASMILATILGTLASVNLARSHSKWTEPIYYILITPMVVPLIIIAVVIYGFFVRLNLQGSFLGLVIAHTIVAIPFVITTVLGSLRSFDIRIEQAAISLGAHPIIAFCKITIPTIMPALISGALFAFISSFDELIISIFVSDSFSKTLPVKMWEGIRLEVDPTLAAIASVLISFSIAVFIALEILKKFSKKRGLA
ncbi:ABC transporter permease [Neobacillus niacini]|uniref:ABC transporter permease n=1 Tax=Neobacillus niacini TaxID=86668 RepID=UPI0028551BB9|nr:ABC transporter permease [Neobacillus niacini]MDR6997825.1 putative spermidine/putrescine transport system permease protein [Neobacillus niacini]